MTLVLLVLLLVVLFAVGGWFLHLLWIVAAVLLVLWLIGFVARSTPTAGGPRSRWYRW